MSRSSNNKVHEAKECLARHRIKHGIYIIGIHNLPITAYEQQIRAFDLFYSLVKTGNLKENSRVLIVGGGISGVTFASACLKAKMYVQIIERKSGLIPFQVKCGKREIYPFLYNWPDTGSLEADANLPILNWTAGKAKHVANDILSGLDSIKKEVVDAGLSLYDHYQYSDRKKEIKAIKYSSKSKFVIEFESPDNKTKSSTANRTSNADIVVFATGYGIERSVFYDNSTPGYWQDFYLDQENLGEKNILISGIGDGGLMDLFTACIQSFKYSNLIKTLKSNDFAKQLEENLSKIKNDFFKGGSKTPGFLYSKFQQIPVEHYKSIFDSFSFRENFVVLNGEQDFENSLRLDKVCMINAFIAFLLREGDPHSPKFEYRKGKLLYDDIEERWHLLGQPTNQFEGYIKMLRHGADMLASFNKLPEISNIIASDLFKKRQLKKVSYGPHHKLWTNESFNKIFIKRQKETALETDVFNIASNAYPLLINLTNSLFNILNIHHDGKKEFRIALQKITYEQGKHFFRQVTPYSTNISEPNILSGGYGKTYPLTLGNVGYSVRSGKPALLVCNDNADISDFYALLEQLAIKVESQRTKRTRTFFSLPILAKYPHNYDKENQDYVTNLVIYIDAYSHDFLIDKILAQNVVAIVNAFVESFNKQCTLEMWSIDELDFEPKCHENLTTLEVIHNSKFFIKSSPFIDYIEKSYNKLTLDNFCTFTSQISE